MPEGRSNDPTRTELEDLWLLKLWEAQRQYYDAAAKWREALSEQQQSPVPSPDGNYAVSRAARVEAVARREYARVLEVFMDLVVKGKVPPSA
ncbi:MAG TPA: hypothetical protein VMA31_15155 [Bryobacteraceae bacterium]|nr:hypothetical protein [Bryobacteraceae bacterium]